MTQDAPKTTEPYVGKELGSVSFTVTEDILNDYYNGLNLSRPQAATVPSMIATGPDKRLFRTVVVQQSLWSSLDAPGVGIVRAADAGPDVYGNRPDHGYLSEAQIARWVRYEVELCADSGELALRTRHHQSYLLDQHGGQTRLSRSQRPNRGRGASSSPEGEPFGPLETRHHSGDVRPVLSR